MSERDQSALAQYLLSETTAEPAAIIEAEEALHYLIFSRLIPVEEADKLWGTLNQMAEAVL
jgi:hypothetical protein